MLSHSQNPLTAISPYGIHVVVAEDVMAQTVELRKLRLYRIRKTERFIAVRRGERGMGRGMRK